MDLYGISTTPVEYIYYAYIHIYILAFCDHHQSPTSSRPSISA